MKRITAIAAIAVTAAAILGCSYVGGAGADTEITSRTTCAQVLGMSELPYTEAFEEISRTNPQMTTEVRDTQIALCESSKAVALSGGSLPVVIAVISSKSSELPEELRKQMLFMSVAGWSIGNKVRQMKTSREQFDEWFNRRRQAMQVAGVARHRIAMLERRMYEAWQASRQCIEVDNRDIVTITCEHGGDVLLRDITSIKIVQYKGA